MGGKKQQQARDQDGHAVFSRTSAIGQTTAPLMYSPACARLATTPTLHTGPFRDRSPIDVLAGLAPAAHGAART